MGFRGVKPYQISPQMGEDRETAARRRLLAQQSQQSDYEQEIAHDQAQNARMENSTDEGTSANGIGGDPTANLPDLIEGQGVAVRPDVRAAESQFYSHKDAERIAISRARSAELARTLREIDVTANSMRPGRIAEFGLAGPTAMVMEQANRMKWNKMRNASIDMARKEHEAKYGLLDSSGLGYGVPGFGGVDRLRF